MFAISTKVKVAAGITAGVLTLGAAGAYAANANNTITTYSLGGTSGTLSHNGQTLSLVSLKQNATLTPPSTPFKNAGQCVSFFAKDKSLALAPKSGTTVNKNYHGKLMSNVQSFCATYESTNGTATQSSAPQTDSADTTDSADATDSGSSASGSARGHAYGHSKHGNGHF